MKKIQSRKEWWQHLAKLANCSNETERISEQVQYFASLGVSDYFHPYNIKKYAKSIKQAKEKFQSNGFTVEDERSGVKGNAVLHISWTNATQGIAFTFACITRQASKTKEIVNKILTGVEEAATNGEYTYQYDFADAGIDFVDSIIDNLDKTGDFSKVELVDNVLILEWRN